MECQGGRKFSQDRFNGEEHKSGNGYRNMVGIDLDTDDTDLATSGKQPVKSWVQRKRDSFEMMCASRNENFCKKGVTIKTIEKNTRKYKNDQTEDEINKAKSISEQTDDKSSKSSEISMSEKDLNKDVAIADQKEEGSTQEVESETHFEPSTKHVTNMELATFSETQKKNYENEPHKEEESIQDTKVESKNLKESSNEPGFVTQKNNDENVNTDFLSRDEAIKLSTNASGTLQPRLSTKAGNKHLIKHGETDSTCNKEETDKIQDKNVKKVSSSMTNNTKVFGPKELDQGLKTIPPPRYNNDCQNFLPAKQTVTPTFGSKDPVVKKMVYNQYREMLRKYTQSSRL